MLPFVLVETPRLGGLPLHPFGILTAIGFFLWDVLVSRRGKRLGYDPKKLRSLQLWGIGMGVFWAHVLDQVFYYPERILENPLSLLYFWQNLSSVGGMIGCALGGVCWKHLEWQKCGPVWIPVRRARPLTLLPFADVIVAYLPLGWAFGRAGCAVIHDHPGIDASAGSLFAVAWPRFEGEGLVWRSGPISILFGSHPRYDLGLLEMVWLLLLAAAMAAVMRWAGTTKPLPIGSHIAIACIGYAPIRFALDFLRVSEGFGSDLRLGALTFAQWTSLAMLAFGVWMLRYAKRLRETDREAELVREARLEAAIDAHARAA